jgi:prophage DNA circulation protein
VAIQDLRGRVAEYLSRLINDLAPVITVEAARQLPSLYWGYRLYGDPARGAEIVARNGVRHPSFVPATFQALSR